MTIEEYDLRKTRRSPGVDYLAPCNSDGDKPSTKRVADAVMNSSSGQVGQIEILTSVEHFNATPSAPPEQDIRDLEADDSLQINQNLSTGDTVILVFRVGIVAASILFFAVGAVGALGLAIIFSNVFCFFLFLYWLSMGLIVIQSARKCWDF